MKREFLKSLGLEPEAIEKIMADYGTSIEALKSKNETLQAKLDDYNTKTLEISDLKKELKTIKGKSGESDAWKEKAESLENEYQKYKAEQEQKFNDYKTQVETEKTRNMTIKAVRDQLKKDLFHDKAIQLIEKELKLEPDKLKSFKLDENGKISNWKESGNCFRTEYADHIGTIQTRTPAIADPPTNHSTNFTIEDVKRMTPDQINKNWDSVKKVINKE